MIHINSNGSKWAGQAPDSIDALFERLGRTPLDPTFENYGNFVDATDREMPRFHGNFYELSAVFSIDSDEPEFNERLTAAIRANQSTEAYQAARNAVLVPKAA